MEAVMGEYNMLAAYPDVENALQSFRGAKQAILSNGSPDMLEPLVAHSGLKFDAVLSVDDLKVYKPAPEVYELAVRKLQVERENIGFVSSNCWDAAGAKSFGFTVYWINRAGAPLDRLGFSPDGVLSGLGELPGKLA
jgi:2-haloacid dehalogenase